MESIDTTELYACRLIVLLETEPQSNVYNQVELDIDKYNSIFGTVFNCSGEAVDVEIDDVNVTLREEIIKLPDIKEHYEE
jgi:hypothetical protein